MFRYRYQYWWWGNAILVNNTDLCLTSQFVLVVYPPGNDHKRKMNEDLCCNGHCYNVFQESTHFFSETWKWTVYFKLPPMPTLSLTTYAHNAHWHNYQSREMSIVTFKVLKYGKPGVSVLSPRTISLRYGTSEIQVQYSNIQTQWVRHQLSL